MLSQVSGSKSQPSQFPHPFPQYASEVSEQYRNTLDYER
jgi:hypothetical protein